MKSIGDRETRLAEQDVDGKGRGGGWSKVDDGDWAKVTGEVLWEPKAAGPVFRANGGTLRGNGGGGETQRTRSISAQDGGGIGAWSKEDDDGWAKVTGEVLWGPKATGPVFRASGGALRGNGGGGERQRTRSISAQDGGGIGAWSKEDDGGAWANLIREVLWDHKSLGNVELEQQKWQPKLQDNEEAVAV